MTRRLKSELSVWASYFIIALIAELAGFLGWLGEMNRSGNQFQVSSAFWNHEVSRLYVWFPVFLILGAIRFGILFIALPQGDLGN